MYSMALIINLYVSKFDLVQWPKFTHMEFSYFALLRRNNFLFVPPMQPNLWKHTKKISGKHLMTIIEIE